MKSLPYTHQAVRDLAWAVGSPQLVSSFRSESALFVKPDEQREMYGDLESLLSELERDPARLTKFLEEKGPVKRLGRYFESLFEFWLKHSSRYQLLHYGLQVRTPKKTIGEFDALIKDRKTGETLHWELAVKFYLYSGTASNPSDWLGPNPKDRFEEKLTHLCRNQSKLSTSEHGKRVLTELEIEVDRSAVLLKGYLFRPEDGSNPLDGCEEDPDHLRGWWKTHSAFNASEWGRSRWCIAPRLRWMSPYENVRNDESSSFDGVLAAIDTELARYPAPLMLIQVEDSQEVSRGFVCPDSWPALGTIPGKAQNNSQTA